MEEFSLKSRLSRNEQNENQNKQETADKIQVPFFEKPAFQKSI
jgi:hypothetical protein